MPHKDTVNIDALIKLASFDVTEEERSKFTAELEDFLAYAEILKEFPSENIVPASHAVSKETQLRQDSIIPWDELDSLLTNGPLAEGTSYIVPPQKKRSGEEKEVQNKDDGTATDTTDYESVIGLEIHAQLKTKSKLFCPCSTEFGKEPNENTCPVCSGQPGVLPVLNKEAVMMAVLAGLTFNCRINKRSLFARKNYFYPDLPKGYQISQFEEPVCSGGYIDIEVDGKKKRVRLNRIHMEEDAGKLVHIGAPGIWGSKASAVDFNRTSIPLIEIVSEADLNTPEEAKEYVIMLRAVLMSLGICDGNMEEGSLRCDANVSIRKRGDKKLGVKTEIKNMNSFKAIERALEFEINRQKDLVSKGYAIEQQTRLWDEGSQKTFLMRTKEDSQDYRYFPDPDLTPLLLNDADIESLKEKVPLLPLERKIIYEKEYSLTPEEARLLMITPSYAQFMKKTMETYTKPRIAANWFFNEILSHTTTPRDIAISPEDFALFLEKIDSLEISGKIGKQVIRMAFESKKGLVQIIDEKDLRQITDEKVLTEIIGKVIANNSTQVDSYKSGKKEIFGYLVGQVMKETKGKANPQIANTLLRTLLDSE